MAWNDLASNQTVSFTDASTGGFTLKPGQENIDSNKCMTKAEALAKYYLSSNNMSGYSDNQLTPKSSWINAPVSTEVKTSYYFFNNTPTVCNWVIEPEAVSSMWVPGANGLVNGSMFYNSSSLSIPVYTVPNDNRWHFCLDGNVRKYYQISSDGYTAKNVGTCA
jgi:hypothetical protein